MPAKRGLSLSLLAAGLAVLLGAGLRLHHLADFSMSHPEMFVPGIPGTAELSVPTPRMDLGTVVKQTLYLDTHPPGYYILMLYVTRFFGSSTVAIRMPSVLFGVASIGLVFWLGFLIGQPIAGCVAALFLALNGYHIVWSRTGRMYSMLCFLGLLTTILLLLLARSDRRRRGLEFLYAALTVLGIATQVVYWPLLATQLAWVLGNAWAQNRPMPRLLKIQILVAILGSPLVAFAAYQSGNPVAILSRDVPRIAREYIQFVYLIPGWDDSFEPGGPPALALAPQFLIPRILLFLFCTLLLIAGTRRLKPAREGAPAAPGGSPIGTWLTGAVIAIGAILVHIILAQRHLYPRPLPTLKYTKAMTPLPLVLALAAIALWKFWDRLGPWCSRRLHLKSIEGGAPLVLMLAVGPFLLLSIVSVFRPLMDPRGLLHLAPYLLLTLAAGVVSLGERSRWAAVALFLILGTLHGFSVLAYRNRIMSPVDYKAFADELKPHLRGDDLLFMHRDWYTAPILYYLTPNQYHLRASHFEEICQHNPNARVWALLFRGEEFPPPMKAALEGYHEVETVEVYWARGMLYCRDSCR